MDDSIEYRVRDCWFNISPAEVDHSFAVSIALRVMPDEVPSLDGLGIEAGIVEAWELCAGLTLVTGVPGSGKSTLLAAGTRRLLEKGAGRIQSFEAPIEYVFDGIAGDAAMMSSAEVPRHFATFADGLRSSLRRRPAAVVVGEARDRETVEAVVRAADYGIAVYSTAHTSGVAATIRRMLAEFPSEERDERGAALVDVLHMVVTQVLVANPEGGRTALREWLVFDSGLKGLLLERSQSEWPGVISERLRKRQTDLLFAAESAFGDGRLGETDYLRIRAGAGMGVVNGGAERGAFGYRSRSSRCCRTVWESSRRRSRLSRRARWGGWWRRFRTSGRRSMTTLRISIGRRRFRLAGVGGGDGHWPGPSRRFWWWLVSWGKSNLT